MTLAVLLLKRSGVAFAVHEFDHQPGQRMYGLEAARQLALAPERVFKTLITAVDAQPSRLAVALVPVAAQLDLHALAAALGVKSISMAAPRDAERATGYVTGGISPLGQRRRLPTVIDQSAMDFETVFVSAGRRGLEVELAPKDLAQVCDARIAAIARPD